MEENIVFLPSQLQRTETDYNYLSLVCEKKSFMTQAWKLGSWLSDILFFLKAQRQPFFVSLRKRKKSYTNKKCTVRKRRKSTFLLSFAIVKRIFWKIKIR